MKTQSYNNFWQRIHQAARNKNFPLRVMFELTYRCNFKCKHCYVPPSYKRRKGELKRKEVFSILDQLKGLGCFYLGFTGGEPFMRKDIMDILRYAKRCGFEVIIYTNGSLIDKRVAPELAALRPNKVDITIPAMTKDAFERISGISGSRDKVFKAIEVLHKRRVDLGFKTCVLKENEAEVRDIQDFAGSLNIPHYCDATILPCLDGSKEPYQYRAQKIVDIIQIEKIKLNRDTTYSWIPNTANLFNCGGGQMKAAITPMGELKICVNIDRPKYNILKSSLKDAWEKLKKFVKSVKPDENYRCNTCALKPYCTWCPAMSWLENRNFTTCNLENRRLAELRKKI